MDLDALGWRPFFADGFAAIASPGWLPARIACEHRTGYLVWSAAGESVAELPGRLQGPFAANATRPAVGDWVAIEPRPHEDRATLRAVLPRQSRFSRRAAGAETVEQVLAANVDTALLVCGLDLDFNLRRLERYLILAWDSGARPVVVLNKADVCEQFERRVAEAEEVAAGAAVHLVSAVARAGLEALAPYLGTGQTAVLLGSSGVGKSTLVNALLGDDRQQTREVRADDSRGRHTTTRRELVCLPGGGLLIDTPGMRELQLWTSEGPLSEAFGDVEELAARCRFRDCRHQGEPDCAVQEAVAAGTLDPGRFASYQKLQREVLHLARQQDHALRLAVKARSRQIRLFSRRRKREEE